MKKKRLNFQPIWKKYPEKGDPTPYEQDFKKTLQARGLSSETILLKTAAIRQFISRSTLTDPLTIAPYHVTEYHQFLTGRKLSTITIRIRMTAVRDYLSWLRNKGVILIDPTALIEFPKDRRSLPKDILSEDEIHAILKSLSGNRRIRRRALIEILYATGIRRKELINLDLYDLNIRERTLLVRQGKGGKDRLLPVPFQTVKSINAWIRKRRTTRTPALFVTQAGQRITDNSLDSIIREIRKKTGIDLPFTPHTFRHSIATHLLRRGADIRYIQAFLGHADLSTTEIYTRIVRDDIRREIDRCHPINRMKLKE